MAGGRLNGGGGAAGGIEDMTGAGAPMCDSAPPHEYRVPPPPVQRGAFGGALSAFGGTYAFGTAFGAGKAG